MNLIPSGVPATMSSREIAELTGKEHRHVLRDIRAMLCELGIGDSGYAQIWTDPQNGQKYPEFQLPKDLTITLVSGYSVVIRHRIVTRWQELEAGAAPKLPQTFAEALRLAAEQAEQIERQAQQIKLAAPKVEVVDNYLTVHKGQPVNEVAKELAKDFDIGSKRLFAFMREKRLINDVNHPYQQHVDAGRFYLQPGTRIDSHDQAVPTATLRVTPKGHFYLRELLKRSDWPASKRALKEAA
jgi:phage antirepressor YoqD-like protein